MKLRLFGPRRLLGWIASCRHCFVWVVASDLDRIFTRWLIDYLVVGTRSSFTKTPGKANINFEEPLGSVSFVQ